MCHWFTFIEVCEWFKGLQTHQFLYFDVSKRFKPLRRVDFQGWNLWWVRTCSNLFSKNRWCLNPELDHRFGSVIFINFELNFWSSSGRFRFEPRFRTKPWQHYTFSLAGAARHVSRRSFQTHPVSFVYLGQSMICVSLTTLLPSQFCWFNVGRSPAGAAADMRGSMVECRAFWV